MESLASRVSPCARVRPGPTSGSSAPRAASRGRGRSVLDRPFLGPGPSAVYPPLFSGLDFVHNPFI